MATLLFRERASVAPSRSTAYLGSLTSAAVEPSRSLITAVAAAWPAVRGPPGCWLAA
jgi:hypothetical protein